MPSPRIPEIDLPGDIVSQLDRLGAPERVQSSALYRTLANSPGLLGGWLEFAWRLRLDCQTPRRLRELMIVRGAQITDCAYELHHHRAMAVDAGVTLEELDGLDGWRALTTLSGAERAALAFMEESLDNKVTDERLEELAGLFPAPQRLEIILTAGLYAMVPRVVDALRLDPPA